MNSPSFRHNFHDGSLARFTLGPRRELTLEIALDPVWNKEAPPLVSARFGDIGNYNEVASFFNALPPPRQSDAFIAEIVSLQYLEEGPNWAIVDFDNYGQIIIQSRHVTES